MKLLYITTKLTGAGGVQRVTLVKTGYLAEKCGHDVTILTTNAKPGEELVYDVNPKIALKNIEPVKNSPAGYFLSYKKLLNNVVDEVEPDIIIMCDNGLKGFFLPFIVKQKIPLVYERHGSKFIKTEQPGISAFNHLKDKFTYRIMSFFAARFDKFVCLTQSGAAEWPERNVYVIPNPLWFEPRETSSLKNKRALTVARHTYEKGYDRLFKIWSEVVLRHPDWVLDVYGEDNPEYDVRQLAADCGLTDHVNFFQPVANIIDTYKETSIYLMASRSEGFGMVLLEAMAVGVPCVAFDCPTGPGEIIRPGQDGFLIADGDIPQFAEHVIRLIENEDIRIEMGARARENAAHFSLEAIMKQWSDLFESLVKRT